MEKIRKLVLLVLVPLLTRCYMFSKICILYIRKRQKHSAARMTYFSRDLDHIWQSTHKSLAQRVKKQHLPFYLSLGRIHLTYSVAVRFSYLS